MAKAKTYEESIVEIEELEKELKKVKSELEDTNKKLIDTQKSALENFRALVNSARQPQPAEQPKIPDLDFSKIKF